ncbi:MAG: hypothetical protein JWO37_1867 [Acidimicrobiales bacterium]|jgi:hypothetical protein|nr:hypothetical protein [Acidimicrobiales bacterium]
MPAESSHIGPPLSTHFAPGARVAVRSSFEGSWCSGYEIAAIVLDADGIAGCRLRRTSDRTVLPAVFRLDEVIPADR